MIVDVWTNLLAVILLVLFLYLGAATTYLLLLAIAYFVRKERPSGPLSQLARTGSTMPNWLPMIYGSVSPPMLRFFIRSRVRSIRPRVNVFAGLAVVFPMLVGQSLLFHYE